MIAFGGQLPEGDDDIWRLVAYIGSAGPQNCWQPHAAALIARRTRRPHKALNRYNTLRLSGVASRTAEWGEITLTSVCLRNYSAEMR